MTGWEGLSSRWLCGGVPAPLTGAELPGNRRAVRDRWQHRRPCCPTARCGRPRPPHGHLAYRPDGSIHDRETFYGPGDLNVFAVKNVFMLMPARRHFRGCRDC